MWYGGNNAPRATVAGKPVAKGIIERRDDLLTLIQKHPKVLAVFTGDEHNYNKTRLDATVPIYPPNWDKPKVELKRPFWQINNGAAGAPVLRAGRDTLVGRGERVLHPARHLPPQRRGPESAARDGEPRDARGAGPRGVAVARRALGRGSCPRRFHLSSRGLRLSSLRANGKRAGPPASSLRRRGIGPDTRPRFGIAGRGWPGRFPSARPSRAYLRPELPSKGAGRTGDGHRCAVREAPVM